jgi:hypothetical protein
MAEPGKMIPAFVSFPFWGVFHRTMREVFRYGVFLVFFCRKGLFLFFFSFLLGINHGASSSTFSFLFILAGGASWLSSSKRVSASTS